MYKVFHVWDQAATASVIAKWQKKKGYDVLVIKNKKHDKLNQTGYYGGKIINNKIIFVLTCLFQARKFDIIHLHDAWFMVHLLKIFLPKKKIIMHYHGTMVRKGMKEWRRKYWERYVDKILVSTTDLLDIKYSKDPIFIPNPVDTELFYSTCRKNNGKCLIVLKKDQSISKTEAILLDHGINVELQSTDPVAYEKFPKILKDYEYYCDIPIINGTIIKANSVVGLQAMSMGLKTIQHDFTIRNELPPNHRPEYVVDLLEEIYNVL